MGKQCSLRVIALALFLQNVAPRVESARMQQDEHAANFAMQQDASATNESHETAATEATAQWHGGNDCGDHVAGEGATCNSRVQWVTANQGKSRQDAEKQIAAEFPTECGCYLDDCGAQIADGHTCNGRVHWLISQKGKSREDAEKQIATEFSKECGCLVPQSETVQAFESANIQAMYATPVTTGDAVLDEYNDPNMGIAFTMIPKKNWNSTRWGFADVPTDYEGGWKQTYVSIMTKNTPMACYPGNGATHGLLLHVTPNVDFWKYFQVIGKDRHDTGSKKGDIVGGPGDGGSHTPGSHRLSVVDQGKDYSWFTEQKNGILKRFNTVYHAPRGDYNEFITNGLSSQAIAGVMRYTHAHKHWKAPNDQELCGLLAWRGHEGQWPFYVYDGKSLKLERTMDCRIWWTQ